MIEYPAVFLLNVYNLNSGLALKRLKIRLSWDRALRKHIRNLRAKGKPVIVVGDLNVARNQIDVYETESVQDNTPGWSDAERISFEDTLETCGLVDAFRMLYPHQKSYTYWDYKSRARFRNHGWRIDYALVTDDMLPAVKDVQILHKVPGSDHCPVLIELTNGIL